MKRRALITLLGGALAWTRAAHGQQATPVIGYLGISSPEPFASRLQAIRDGLSETGYVEGRKVTIDYRWAENQFDRLGALASDLVNRRPSTIVAAGSIAGALAAKAATTTIPIVFETGADPVAAGRQHHRRDVVERGGKPEASGTPARVDPERESRGTARQPGQCEHHAAAAAANAGGSPDTRT